MTVPSFLSMDTAGRVLRVSSLSKVMMAGLRVGWVTGPTELITTMQLASYSQIVHPCSLAQVGVILTFINCIDKKIRKIQSLFMEKQCKNHPE